MPRIVALLLCLTDLALAMAVFTLLARPERFVGFFAAAAGEEERWQAGQLDEVEQDQLLGLARAAQKPALLLLFAWSFVTGAVMTWARL